MTIHSNDPHASGNDPRDPRRTRSPAAWLVGLAFFLVILGVLALYSGEDWKPKSGDNPPNVVSESRGSK